MESQLLDTFETAVYIHRSPNFVRRTLQYEVNCQQRGDNGPLYFRRSDLDVWIAQTTRVPVR